MDRILQLADVFFKIGLFSIGGGYAVIPLIQTQVVDKYGWITQQTFTDIITISQMTPGPLAVNTSTFIGIRIAGIPGAVAATAGCVVSGVCLSACLYRFFKRHKKSRYIPEVLRGLKAGSLGLIASAAVTILMLTFTGSGGSDSGALDWTAALLFAGSLTALRRWKVNPVLMLAVTGAVGAAVYLI